MVQVITDSVLVDRGIMAVDVMSAEMNEWRKDVEVVVYNRYFLCELLRSFMEVSAERGDCCALRCDDSTGYDFFHFPYLM